MKSIALTLAVLFASMNLVHAAETATQEPAAAEATDTKPLIADEENAAPAEATK